MGATETLPGRLSLFPSPISSWAALISQWQLPRCLPLSELFVWPQVLHKTLSIWWPEISIMQLSKRTTQLNQVRLWNGVRLITNPHYFVFAETAGWGLVHQFNTTPTHPIRQCAASSNTDSVIKTHLSWNWSFRFSFHLWSELLHKETALVINYFQGLY